MRLKYLFVDEVQDSVLPHRNRVGVWNSCLLQTLQLPLLRVFLTATFPPHLKQVFYDQIHARDNISLVRTSTNRPELAYLVVNVENPLTTMDATLNLTQALLGQLRDQERMIVFHYSGHDAERFAQNANCAYYHSKISEERKHEQLRYWDSGESKVLSATTAAGQGIDRPFIKFVVINEGTYGMISYIQEVGRMGRRGDDSFSFLVRSNREDRSLISMDRFSQMDKHCLNDLRQYAAQNTICRRFWISETMDGPDLAFTCNDGGSNPCDICDPSGKMLILAKKAILTTHEVHQASICVAPKPATVSSSTSNVQGLERHNPMTQPAAVNVSSSFTGELLCPPHVLYHKESIP